MDNKREGIIAILTERLAVANEQLVEAQIENDELRAALRAEYGDRLDIAECAPNRPKVIKNREQACPTCGLPMFHYQACMGKGNQHVCPRCKSPMRIVIDSSTRDFKRGIYDWHWSKI